MQNIDVMLKRLGTMHEEYVKLSEDVMNPAMMADNREYAKLAKKQASMRNVMDKYEELLELRKHLSEAIEMSKEKDAELRELAEMEVEDLEPKHDEMVAQLEILLIPKDPNDDHNAIVEIRGAAGGDEGNIFAGDLFRMYQRYADVTNFKIEILEASEAEMGGYTLISFLVKGDEAYRHLKFESGSHRVQRVPKTETQGRVHTSTATVLVMPDIEEEESEIDMADLTFETHRASGAGGQHVNKTDSAVRVTHVPTGISVNCQDGRSQHENRATALRIIRAKVTEVLQERAEAEKGIERKAKIGTGDRSEKIRTYNYPQNRVTDHRIGLTLNQLDRIVEGKLGDVVDALLEEEQRQKLAGNA